MMGSGCRMTIEEVLQIIAIRPFGDPDTLCAVSDVLERAFLRPDFFETPADVQKFFFRCLRRHRWYRLRQLPDDMHMIYRYYVRKF